MKNIDSYYTMPHSDEAEMALLGCLIIENEIWARVADSLIEFDFYQEKNRVVFLSIQSLLNNNEPADIVTISNVLRKNNKTEVVGGDSYLEELINCVSDVSNVISYLDIIKETAFSRRIISTAKEIIHLTLNNKDKNNSIFEV